MQTLINIFAIIGVLSVMSFVGVCIFALICPDRLDVEVEYTDSDERVSSLLKKQAD